MKRLFALLVAAVVASACGAGGPLAPTPTGSSAAGAFTLSGAVADADGGRPIGGAHVEVSNAIDSRSAVSESDGLFSVQGLRPGLWNVTVSKLGYDFQSISVEVSQDTTVNFELSRSEFIPRRPRPETY